MHIYIQRWSNSHLFIQQKTSGEALLITPPNIFLFFCLLEKVVEEEATGQ